MRWSEEEYNAYQIKRRTPLAVAFTPAVEAKPIIRQSKKGPNKTERRFLAEHLEPMLALGSLTEIGEHESITLKLANGLRYTPDWPAWAGDQLTFYEVKGARVWEDSLVKLKVAASKYPHFRFILCKYAKGEWVRQEVLP